MLSVVACNKSKGDGSDDATTADEVAKFQKMLAESVPTSSNTVVTHDVNNYVIENVSSLVTGTVSGKKAAVYTSSVNTLGSVEDRVLQHLRTKNETVWYLEGYGTSTNKGKSWKESGNDFSPVAGSLSMDLREKYISSYKYSQEGAIETLKITMTAENATLALANFLDSNQTIKEEVTITITAAAERISSITIKYTIPEHDVGTEDNPVFLEDVIITIKSDYSYKTDTGDIPITLG